MANQCDKMCRTCASAGHFLFPLFGPKGRPRLVETIVLISNIRVDENDGFPQSICASCVKDLDTVEKLIKRCKESDEYFRQELVQPCDGVTIPKIISIEEDVQIKEEDESVGDLVQHVFDIDDIIEEEIIDPNGEVQAVEQTSHNDENANSNSNVDDLIIVDQMALLAESQEANYTQCCGCVESFASHEELRRHSDLYHRSEQGICGPVPDNLIECSICYKMFSGILYLDSMHRLNAFKNRLQSIGFPEVMQCCSCDAMFSSREEMKVHSQEHIADRTGDDPLRPFECEICFKRYGKKQTMNFHQKFSSSYKKRLESKKLGIRAIKRRVKIESSTESRNCCGCSAEFPSADSLKQHSQMHHELYRQQADSDNPFECETCFKRFPTLIRLEQHRLVPYARKHKCNECEKSFRSLATLTKHTRQHHSSGEDNPNPPPQTPNQSTQCEQCGKFFKNKYLLASHKKSHSQEKPFSCSLCPSRFKMKHMLQTHLRVHTKEQPYSCSTCARTFTQLADKQRHELTHTGRYPLRCSICDKGFPAGRQKLLAKHEKLHQDGEEYPLTCQFCDRTFTRLAQRNRHQARHVAERDRNMKQKMEEIGMD